MVTKVIFLLLFLFPLTSFSQTEEDSLSAFYSMNDQLEIKKIEREHIPLDGNEVSMIPFRVDDKFGFVDKIKGNWIVQPIYQQVFAVYKEGAIVKGNNGYGLIDNKGKVLIPLQFENLIKENGLYCGTIFGLVDKEIKNDMYNSLIFSIYYDEKGKGLFVEQCHDFKSFQGKDTLAWFRYGKKYTVRSKTGRVVKKFNYDVNSRFIGICNNLLIYAFINNNESINYKAFDVNGLEVFSIPLNQKGVDGIFQLSEDLYGYYFDDGDFFFTDRNGVDKPYGMVSESVGFFKYEGDFFDTKLFAVKDLENEKMGIINQKGDTVMPFKWKYLIHLASDTFLNESNELLNSQGEILFQIPNRLTVDFKTQTNQDLNFNGESYLIKNYFSTTRKDTGGKIYQMIDGDHFVYSYINRTGEKLLELAPNYTFATDFHDGLAAVTDSTGLMGFVDEKGQLIIPMNYELSMAGSYPMPYLVVPEFKHGYAYIKSFKGYIGKDGKKYFSGKRMKDTYNFSH